MQEVLTTKLYFRRHLLVTMIKKIAVFGATGFIGLPVTRALVEAGYEVSVLVRDKDKAKTMLPEGVQLVEGNITYHYDLKRFLSGVDAVYCSLSTTPKEKVEDYHIETDGLREIINACQECGIRRFVYLSSMIQNYQGENNFDWWVFQVKNEAINYVRDSGMPFTIFYPSYFMENIFRGHKKGKAITLIGESKFPIYFISAIDFAAMVVNSFKVLGNEDREYNVQGPDCYSMREAADIVVKHYTREKLKIRYTSLEWVKFLGLFDSNKRYVAKVMEAYNNYSEIFSSEMTWDELGKPATTLAAYAGKA